MTVEAMTPERLKEHEEEIASINLHGVDCPRSEMAEELATALREAWGVMDEVANDQGCPLYLADRLRQGRKE
jgi:hypothetical protein